MENILTDAVEQRNNLNIPLCLKIIPLAERIIYKQFFSFYRIKASRVLFLKIKLCKKFENRSRDQQLVSKPPLASSWNDAMYNLNDCEALRVLCTSISSCASTSRGKDRKLKGKADAIHLVVLFIFISKNDSWELIHMIWQTELFLLADSIETMVQVSELKISLEFRLSGKFGTEADNWTEVINEMIKAKKTIKNPTVNNIIIRFINKNKI